jgi:hypothetical protein
MSRAPAAFARALIGKSRRLIKAFFTTKDTKEHKVKSKKRFFLRALRGKSFSPLEII